MKISLVSRTNQHSKWGGDLKALQSLLMGIKSLGDEAEIVASCYDLDSTDFVFLTNTCLDLRDDQKILELRGLPYGLIGFHEDTIQYFGPSIGFFEYIRKCLYNETDDGISFSLEALEENPHLIHYYGLPPRKSNIINYEILKNAKVCIANSPTEAKTMLRDCPSSNVKEVFLPPGFAEDYSPTSSEEFLSLIGLKSKEYILQVGRLEFRKNQLGSIVASKDLDIPLVFIATKGSYEWYETACIDAILKWRKAPTIIVAESLAPRNEKGLQIIPMPGGKKLSSSMLQSAFFHAGLHLHPAFQELPGYTYFESTVLGIPTIASSWATIKDYFVEPLGDDRIEYCLPFDLPEMKRLIPQKFTQTFSPKPDHPAFRRTGQDMAREILSHII
ncbi:MAG: hypothetical protein NTX49_05850 [Chlamydiae bacterium]|nr:hypothetical protein [Chlamydiota bacterium]